MPEVSQIVVVSDEELFIEFIGCRPGSITAMG
jgi:hypothetical protein